MLRLCGRCAWRCCATPSMPSAGSARAALLTRTTTSLPARLSICRRRTFNPESAMSDIIGDLSAAATKHNIGGYHRHVFLCTGPSCCTPETGLAAWETLKQSLKDKGLLEGANACYRTKVGCLRICCHGPTMLVYPEGTWYHGMTAERIPLFVRQHLAEGKAGEEWIFARNSLPNP